MNSENGYSWFLSNGPYHQFIVSYSCEWKVDRINESVAERKGYCFEAASRMFGMAGKMLICL